MLHQDSLADTPWLVAAALRTDSGWGERGVDGFGEEEVVWGNGERPVDMIGDSIP